MTPPLDALRERSAHFSIGLWHHIAGEAPTVPRHALVASAVSLAHEHHSAIVRLVESKHFAAAAALLRPLVEATTTAAWALYVPSVELVEGLFWNRTRLPKPSTMLSRLQSRPELKGELELKPLMDGPGVLFHEFTHGDMVQLRRRFGTIGNSFSEFESVGILMIADTMLVIAASLYEVIKRGDPLRTFVATHANAMVEDVRAAGGMPDDVWKGWRPLPDAVVPTGEAPEDRPTGQPSAIDLDADKRGLRQS